MNVLTTEHKNLSSNPTKNDRAVTPRKPIQTDFKIYDFCFLRGTSRKSRDTSRFCLR